MIEQLASREGVFTIIIVAMILWFLTDLLIRLHKKIELKYESFDEDIEEIKSSTIVGWEVEFSCHNAITQKIVVKTDVNIIELTEDWMIEHPLYKLEKVILNPKFLAD